MLDGSVGLLISVTMAIALVGCSTEGEPVEGPASSPPPPSSITSVPAQTEQPTSTTDSTPDIPTPLPGQFAPQVSASQFEHDMAEATAACAAEQGVVVEVDGGGVLYTPPPGLEEETRAVVKACSKETAIKFGVEFGDHSPEAMESWYGALLWTYNCMIENGYHVSEPPSLDVYVESGGAAWHPYNAIMTGTSGEVAPGIALTEATFRHLENTCPQDLTYLLTVLRVLDE